MNTQKFAAAVLAASMVLVLSACNNSKEDKQAKAASSDPLAKYETAVTVNYGRALNSNVKFMGGETADSNTWTKLYKDALNVDVKNMWVVDQNQSTTKLNTAIASGSYPDILALSISDYVKYAKQGVLTDVTSLYNSYLTSNAKKYLASDSGYAENAIKVNGKLYGIPLISYSYDSANLLWIRKDWLQKLNLSTPKTVDDLAKIAQAFTENDPDGDGKKDTVGLALDGKDVSNWWGGVEPFFEQYGAYPLGLGYATNFSLVSSGGKLVYGGSLSGTKAALTALQTYYKNGWIAQDFGTQDYNQAMSQVNAGKAGMFYAPMFGAESIPDFLKDNPNGSWVAVQLPGTSSSSPAKAFVPSSCTTVVCVSSKFKNPEALFKVFDLGLEKVAYTNDADTYAKYNGDGKNYTGWQLALASPLLPAKNRNNYLNVSAAVKSKDTSKLNVEQTQYYNDIVNNYLGKPVNAKDSAYITAYGEYTVFADPEGGYAAENQMITDKNYTEAGFGGAPTNEMTAVSSTLSDLIKTNLIKIIYGSESVDQWDSVVSQWSSLGGVQVLKDANSWYQSSNASSSK